MFPDNYECENQMSIFDFLDNDEQKIKIKELLAELSVLLAIRGMNK